MEKICRVIELITNYVSGLLMAWSIFGLMVLVIVEVVSRYVLNQPLSIADEYGGYMLVAITMIGLAYTWKEKGHISVDLVVNQLSPGVQTKLRLATLLLAGVLSVVLVAAGYKFVAQSFLFGARSGSWLRTPVAWPQLVLIIGSVLLAAQLFVEIVRLVRQLAATKGEK